MAKNNRKEFILFRDKVIVLIFLLCSLVTLYAIYKFNAIPTKYLMIIVGVILLLFLIGALITMLTKPGKLKNFGKVYSLILSLLLLLGTRYLVTGNSFLGKLTGANKDTHVISVVVMKDSKYKSIEDVKELPIGANTRLDSKNITKGKKLIDEKYKSDINIVDYEDYTELANDLYDGTQEVILLSEAHRGFIQDEVKDFDDKTRIIGTVAYEEEVDFKNKNADVMKDTFSMFVTGIDTYGPVSSVSRSDVNMIMTVDPKNKQILLTSIPRDYHVELASFGAYDKLTHAGIYGVGESMATLENLFDIDIDYFVKVNFSSVETIIDALGGVDVYSRYAFQSFAGVYFDEGINHVDGRNGLIFARERYNLPNGDNDRVKNQQALITGILKKAMSPAIITNYTSILNSVSDSFQMSMEESDFKKLIKQQINDMSDWDIQSYAVTGTGSSSTTTYSMPGPALYVMEPNYDTVRQAHDYIEAMERHEVISVSE
ncbi:LCP family protein [Erysipelothrix rhusiopathiae]|uniref:LCP family protein n=1 Tax=Erysipelothrix rhusiopathiae TaxID=1648 RepID=UPI000F43552A|nr:LCP family protein [Erysipelothrix rhusiopathiae]AYV33999.1 transcriptional regulator [Erysipelothrix rhusiopathiae]MDE8081602.1 LCP family protein [Erysipelothrix rhusiopathiae]MDE8267755.1 LCP family protein [Erysipelothrix rhusiopathiae]MDE8328825.1 LCP family protein [Erysipelothrix rhusiopathiae]MDE8332191.1 LCP family protein [Erysipelothrix rhusiopathiae]